MPAIKHTYQSTDLTTTKRREFLSDALEGVARIRLPDGETLVTLPEQDLAVLTETRSYFIAYLQLQSALRREPGDRRAAELGELAWATVLEDEDFRAFADELSSSLAVSLASHDVSPVRESVRAWRLTADLWSDTDARGRINGPVEDFQELSIDRVKSGPEVGG